MANTTEEIWDEFFARPEILLTQFVLFTALFTIGILLFGILIVGILHYFMDAKRDKKRNEQAEKIIKYLNHFVMNYAKNAVGVVSMLKGGDKPGPSGDVESVFSQKSEDENLHTPPRSSRRSQTMSARLLAPPHSSRPYQSSTPKIHNDQTEDETKALQAYQFQQQQTIPKTLAYDPPPHHEPDVALTSEKLLETKHQSDHRHLPHDGKYDFPRGLYHTDIYALNVKPTKYQTELDELGTDFLGERTISETTLKGKYPSNLDVTDTGFETATPLHSSDNGSTIDSSKKFEGGQILNAQELAAAIASAQATRNYHVGIEMDELGRIPHTRPYHFRKESTSTNEPTTDDSILPIQRSITPPKRKTRDHFPSVAHVLSGSHKDSIMKVSDVIDQSFNRLQRNIDPARQDALDRHAKRKARAALLERADDNLDINSSLPSESSSAKATLTTSSDGKVKSVRFTDSSDPGPNGDNSDNSEDTNLY